MDKIRLYVDFDDTMVNTTKAVVRVLNKYYGSKKHYKMARHNLFNMFPNITKNDVDRIYNQTELFDSLEIFDGCKEFMYFFQDAVDTTIVTVASGVNEEMKNEFFYNTKLPINSMICLDYIGDNTEKTVVDMSNSVFIDNNIEVIKNSNAKIKIWFNNFEDEYDSSELEDIYVVSSWDEIGDIIQFYVNQGGII